MKNWSQNCDFSLNRQFYCVELNTFVSPLARSGQLAAASCQGILLWRQKKHIAEGKWCRANPCCKIIVAGKYFVVLAFPQGDCWQRLSMCIRALCCFVWWPLRLFCWSPWSKYPRFVHSSDLSSSFWILYCALSHLHYPHFWSGITVFRVKKKSLVAKGENEK